jgi:hypothetical protein
VYNKFSKLAVLAAIIGLLGSCATIRVAHPGIDSVKKIAVISVTSNYNIPNIKLKQPEAASNDLKSLGTDIVTALTKKNDSNATKGQAQIVTHGAVQLESMFSGLNGWELVPVAKFATNQDFKALLPADPTAGASADAANLADKIKNTAVGLLQSAAQADVVAPQGMPVIRFSSLLPTQGTSITIVNGKRVESPRQQLLNELGALCGKLGVDAVVISEVKLAYKPGIVTMQSGFLGRIVRSNASPVVETNVAIVNAKGELVLNSKPGWKAFYGKSAPILLNDKVDLLDEKGLGIISYNEAVDASVGALKANVVKTLTKK